MSRELTKNDLKFLTKIPLNVRRQLCRSLNFDNFDQLILSAFKQLESMDYDKSTMKFLNQKGGAIPAKYQFLAISLILVAGVMLTMYYYNTSYSPELLKKIQHAKVLVEDTAGIIIDQAKLSYAGGREIPVALGPHYTATDTTLKLQMQITNPVPASISTTQYKEGVKNQTLIADKLTNDIITNVWTAIGAMITGILVFSNLLREKRGLKKFSPMSEG